MGSKLDELPNPNSCACRKVPLGAAMTLLAKTASSKAEQHLIFIILFTPRWFTFKSTVREY